MTKATGCRHRLSGAQERELWARLKQGETLTAIGRTLATRVSSLYGLVRRHGGIAPPPRTRAPRVLTSLEREEISRGLAADDSSRVIAHALGRAPSTISRELIRHGGRTHYRADEADRTAWQHARRPQRCRLARHAGLRQVVAAKLAFALGPAADQWVAGDGISRRPHDARVA